MLTTMSVVKTVASDASSCCSVGPIPESTFSVSLLRYFIGLVILCFYEYYRHRDIFSSVGPMPESMFSVSLLQNQI